jgi:hypothetical protein
LVDEVFVSRFAKGDNVGPINGRSRAPAPVGRKRPYLRLRSVALAGYPTGRSAGSSSITGGSFDNTSTQVSE